MTAQQLKASILQLAIQGKLVPQNPADEPASVLLKRIKSEKDALVKAGKLKKDKHESVIIRGEDGRYLEKKDGKTTDITDEIQFDIPDTWEWVRLKTLFLQASTGPFGSMLHQSDYVEKGVPLVNPADIINATISDIKIKKVSSSTAERLATYKLSSQDVVIGRRGEMGRSAVVSNRENGWLCGTGCFFVTPSSGLLPDYLVFLLSTPHIKESLLCKSVGTTMNNLNHGILGYLLIPLPPKTEQKRILAKFEELLTHIEEYGKAETALSTLNAELPEQLKKSILQWAIQGRLVPQDPTDEPASELLKRIKAEKAALIKFRKLKKEKPLPPITEDEIPFDIPESWQWVRCGDVFQHNTGKALNSTDRNGCLLEYITTSNLYWNRFALDKLRKMYFSDGEIEKCTARKGDLLVCEGGDFGRAAIWSFDRPICIQNHIHRLRAFAPVSTAFFYYLFLFYKTAGLIGGKGIGIQGLSSNALHALVFPLPPLAEQNRIVEKLESILDILKK